MSVWYAGRWRTPEGVESHRAATRARMASRHTAGELWKQQPENRLRAAISTNQSRIRRRQETH